MGAPAANVDWSVVENAYRLGVKSIRTIAAEHGISEGLIRQYAKKNEWTRDLSYRVKEKAQVLIAKHEVKKAKVAEATKLKDTERQQVDIAARIQADVILSHRSDIGRARKLCFLLLAEIEEHSSDKDGMLEKLGELLEDPKASIDKLNDIYRGVISLPGRIDNIRKLADAIQKLITLERQAYSITDAYDPDRDAAEASARAAVQGATSASIAAYGELLNKISAAKAKKEEKAE